MYIISSGANLRFELLKVIFAFSVFDIGVSTIPHKGSDVFQGNTEKRQIWKTGK